MTEAKIALTRERLQDALYQAVSISPPGKRPCTVVVWVMLYGGILGDV